MNVKTHLLNYFSSLIHKDSEVFSSLMANPSTKNKGAIEKELETMLSYLADWYGITNIYETTSDRLDRFVSFISYLERFTDETDKSLINRVSSIFVRNKSTSWGSRINVLNVFKQYFSLADVFVTENTNDMAENLIENYDFSSFDESWTFENAEQSDKARYSKAFGGLLNNSTSIISQSVNVAENTTYFLHFFSKGNCKVVFESNDGLFWNNTTKEWQESESFYQFENESWRDNSIWIRCTNQTSITIKFVGVEDKCFIDYIRLFEKYSYSTFTVVVHFNGASSVKAMALAPGNEDPYIELDKVEISPKGNLIYKDKVLPEENPLRLDEEGNLYTTDENFYIKDGKLYTTLDNVSESWYSKAFYYDRAFYTGAMSGFAMDIYEDLLQYLKATGVNAFLEIISRDYQEGEEE